MALGTCLSASSGLLDYFSIGGALTDLLDACHSNLSYNVATLRLFYLEMIPRDLIETGGSSFLQFKGLTLIFSWL